MSRGAQARARMRLSVLGIACFLATTPAPARAQVPRVRTELDTALVLVGDRMTLTVRVEHDPASNVVWPDSLALGPLEVVGAEILPTTTEGQVAVTTARFTLAVFELGDLEIPSFDLEVAAADGSSTTVSTAPYMISVRSVGLDESGDIRAIRGPLGIPLSVFYVLPWLALGALLAALVYWVWSKRRGTEPSAPRSVTIPRFPHEEALDALERLENAGLLERGEIKEYHILASEIVRTYVEGRFGVYALEMTTGEVVDGLRGTRTADEVVVTFEQFASRCDLVKFAKLRPEPDACRALLETARAFVRRTQPPPYLDDDAADGGEARGDVGAAGEFSSAAPARAGGG